MRTFNVALVGCGVISANHLRALKRLGNVNVIALCDIDRKKAENRKEQFELPSKIYENFEEMLECEKLDAIHVTTPHYLHFPMAKAALERNINVVLEKPSCMTAEELASLIEIEKHSQARVCVCFQTRYNPTTVLAKKIAAEDGGAKRAIATVFWNRDNNYYASGPWRGRMETEGGGVLINQAIHTLDLLCGLFGKPDTVIATTSNHHLDREKYDVEDSAEGIIRFENGGVANFYATTSFGGQDDTSVTFFTENHRVEISMNKVYLDGNMVSDPSLAHVYYGKQVYGNGHECLIENYYNALDSGDPMPIGLEESQYPLRILLAAYASHDKPTKV